MSFLVRVIVNAAAIWVAAWILPGMAIAGNKLVAESLGQTGALIVSYLVVGAIFGLANALVKPIVSAISAPITCLTLGLFSIVINALMLWLTAWLSGFTPFIFTIDHFVTAVIAAIIVSLVSAVLGVVIPERRASREYHDSRDYR